MKQKNKKKIKELLGIFALSFICCILGFALIGFIARITDYYNNWFLLIGSLIFAYLLLYRMHKDFKKMWMKLNFLK